jgi:outer membrane protein TolC
MQRAIEMQSMAMESQNLADSQLEPLTYNQSLSRSTSTALSGFEHEFGFSKELKLGNLQEIEQRQRRLNNEASTLEQKQYIVELKNRVKNSYHQYCLNRDYKETFQNKVTQFNELYSKKEKAYKEDEIAKTELLQIELEKNRLENELVRFNQQVEDEKDALLTLTNFDNREQFSCQDLLPLTLKIDIESSGFPITEEAYSKRIESTQVGLKRYENKIDTIEVSAGYLRELERDVYTIGISIPLNSSSRQQEYERASLMHHSSALTLQNETLVLAKEQQRKALIREVKRTYQAVTAQEETINSFKSRLLPLVEKSYKYGESSVVEYLLSQQQLNQLQEQLLEKKRGYYEKLFTLYTISEKK